jgi:energy-coupling factor transporter ATP-binding protein EcfA2
MRIVAIYIKEHDYLFSEPQIINLGGKFLYIIEEKKDAINVTRKLNELFIDGFFSIPNTNKLDLISAIVGQNGSGKSSLLNAIRRCFIENQSALPDSKILILAEKADDELCFVYSNFDKIKLSENKKTIDIKWAGKDATQTIYYSPHYDYSYSHNFDRVDSHDISFDKILEEDLEDLSNKDTNENGWAYSASEELIFKNSVRHIQFLASSIVQKNIGFKKMFQLPSSNNAILEFRAHTDRDDWNTPRQFSSIIKGINTQIEKEKATWNDIIKLDDQGRTLNQIDVNKLICKCNIIKHILSVLFRKMQENNMFLQEGTFLQEVPYDQYSNYSAYDLFISFIQNAQLKYNNAQHSAFDHVIIKELIDLIYKEIDNINDLENIEQTLIVIPRDSATSILELHRKFRIDLSYFYMKAMPLSSRDYRNNGIIDGFINYRPSLNKLSSGQTALLNLFSRLYSLVIEKLDKDKPFNKIFKHYLLLLDEADLAFHPTWKKKYITSLIETLPSIFSLINTDVTFQILFTTHDPLTLSDIPTSNIIYLKTVDEDGISEVLKLDSILRPKHSFGANISDLLSDSFFIEDGLVGHFAKSKIERTLFWLKMKANEFANTNKKEPIFKDLDSKIKFSGIENTNEYHKKIIEIIGEPVIKHQLNKMYMEFVDDDVYINEQIDKLRNLKKNKNA